MPIVYVVYSMSTNYDYNDDPCGDTFTLVGIFTDGDTAKNLCKKDCDNEWKEIELDKEVNEYF